MSNRTLVYSPLSRCDLDEIFDYISSELENPVAAQETVNAILDGAFGLCFARLNPLTSSCFS